MASASWTGRVGLLLVAVAVVVPVLATHHKPSSKKKSIARPDFSCGEPWKPDGTPPAHHRGKRQIIFPDEENYQQYWGLLIRQRDPHSRKGEKEKPKQPANQEEEEEVFCGASPISDRFIITAAHCVLDPSNPVTSVRLGDIDLSKEGESNSRPADYDILEIFVHPSYNEESTVRYNDVALLKTAEKIQFNDVVFPFCISDRPPAPGTIVTASGFGLFNATTQPDHLLEANFTVLDSAECEKVYLGEGLEASLRARYPNLLQKSDIICAIDDVSDSCQGDSGGPLFLVKNGKRFLEGIVSGGASCRGNFKSSLPGLYVSLAKHVDYISDVIHRPQSLGLI